MEVGLAAVDFSGLGVSVARRAAFENVADVNIAPGDFDDVFDYCFRFLFRSNVAPNEVAPSGVW